MVFQSDARFSAAMPVLSCWSQTLDSDLFHVCHWSFFLVFTKFGGIQSILHCIRITRKSCFQRSCKQEAL